MSRAIEERETALGACMTPAQSERVYALSIGAGGNVAAVLRLAMLCIGN